MAAAHNVQFSAVDSNSALTINAGAFREDLGLVSVNVGSMTVTLGDLVDNFSAQSITTTGEFNLTAGGNNGSVSAHITQGDFGSSFTISMADIGNGGLSLDKELAEPCSLVQVGR